MISGSALRFTRSSFPTEESGRSRGARPRGLGARHHHSAGRSRVVPAISEPIQEVTRAAEADSPVSSGAVSSSDVSVSSEEGIPEGQACMPNHLTIAELRWLVTRRSKLCHIVQEEADGLLIPWCRSSAFSGSPAEVGANPCSQSLAICLGCMRRMPADTREAIRIGLDDTSPSEQSDLE